jgi:hypothetical protein
MLLLSSRQIVAEVPVSTLTSLKIEMYFHDFLKIATSFFVGSLALTTTQILKRWSFKSFYKFFFRGSLGRNVVVSRVFATSFFNFGRFEILSDLTTNGPNVSAVS